MVNTSEVSSAVASVALTMLLFPVRLPPVNVTHKGRHHRRRCSLAHALLIAGIATGSDVRRRDAVLQVQRDDGVEHHNNPYLLRVIVVTDMMPGSPAMAVC